ncbi:MAG: ABC transporter permease [Butyribacter sp.]|nr:ABC transporter permease [bacterium]MDY3854460.1 ABC transporter permease [Butyribacter sp.]
MKLFIARLKGFFQYRDLMGQLVSRDLKLKYRRSVLGYLWSILNPLFIMIIMAIVFSQMFKRDNIPNYPVYLMSGQVLFNFMNQSTHQSLGAIVGSAALIKKTYLPKYVFVVSKITSGLIDCIFSFGALLIVMLFTHGHFSWYLLLFPLVVLQLYVFNIGLGMFLSAYNVFFRDIQYIYNAITTAWLYLTPMFYPVEALPEQLRWIVVHLNPMYAYVTQLRCLTLYGVWPDAHMVLYGCVDACIMLIIGVWVFAKKQDRFILYI